MDDLVTYLVVTCNYNNSVSWDEGVMNMKVLHATVAFLLKVRWVNAITIT